jgi:tetratricopeptide (TPR) repeat protein
MSYSGLMKVYELWQAGDAAYREGRHRASAELYRQAMELADEDEDVPRWFRGVMRRAFADELVSADHLREALAVLAVIPKESVEGYEACCIYGNMTDHIEIAQRLPTSLRSIERAYARAEDYFRAAGERDWAGRLLYYKSELLAARGLYREALDVAREGFSFKRESCPKLFPVTHARGLFEISLALGDLEEARRYLARWGQLYEREEKKSVALGAAEHLMRSQLARAEGDAHAAVEHARQGTRKADLLDWVEIRYELNVELVRACLAAGRLVLARATLARLAPLRRAENGHWRYAYRLLRGDYHLAAARGNEAATARAALKKARRAYGEALKVGVWIDTQLECFVRGPEVEDRLARLAEVERVVEGGPLALLSVAV